MDRSSSAIDDEEDLKYIEEMKMISCKIRTESTGDEDDGFCDICCSILFDARDAVRRDNGKSYINKPEGNNDGPLFSFVGKK